MAGLEWTAARESTSRIRAAAASSTSAVNKCRSGSISTTPKSLSMSDSWSEKRSMTSDSVGSLHHWNVTSTLLIVVAACNSLARSACAINITEELRAVDYAPAIPEIVLRASEMVGTGKERLFQFHWRKTCGVVFRPNGCDEAGDNRRSGGCPAIDVSVRRLAC
jgi:hypothetical protein